MSCYFEKRPYARQEIAELLELDSKSTNFAKNVKTKLRTLGFTEDQYIYTSKNITILWVPSSYEEKIAYLVRLLGVDKQVDPLAFATFLYHLALNGEYECDKMPWAERTTWLKQHTDIEVSERTMQSWTKKLIDKGILTRAKADFQLWCSAKVNNELIRYPVITEEEILKYQEYVDYCKNYSGIIGSEKAMRSFIYSSAWDKFQRTYYKCSSIAFCAWEENPIMRELRDLILEHFEH